MTTAYTSCLRLAQQGDGDNPNSWGTVLNDGVIGLIDNAIAGHEFIVCSGVTVKQLEIRIMNEDGKLVPLHGANVSFSLVFDIIDTKSYFSITIEFLFIFLFFSIYIYYDNNAIKS